MVWIVCDVDEFLTYSVFLTFFHFWHILILIFLFDVCYGKQGKSGNRTGLLWFIQTKYLFKDLSVKKGGRKSTLKNLLESYFQNPIKNAFAFSNSDEQLFILFIFISYTNLLIEWENKNVKTTVRTNEALYFFTIFWVKFSGALTRWKFQPPLFHISRKFFFSLHSVSNS